MRIPIISCAMLFENAKRNSTQKTLCRENENAIDRHTLELSST